MCTAGRALAPLYFSIVTPEIFLLLLFLSWPVARVHAYLLGALRVCAAQVTLDTPNNRKWMSGADFSSWTTLEYVAELMVKWELNPGDRPTSGSLVKLVTVGGNTTLEMV